MDLTAIFPLVFKSEEVFLLTAVLLGFLFGFSLERAGFGSARKLAAQFYLYDMTVFKVMFTAILVASVGFWSLSALGFVSLPRMWLNPTFLWAQVIGGFLLGVGFIVSGLCPGTAAVSMASGRWDALVALLGIVVGTAAFAVAIDVFPGLLALYESGGEVVLLPALLGVPAPLLLVGIVVMAAGAFVGAEKVERIFRAKHGVIELTPEATPRSRRGMLAMAGTLAVVALAAFVVPAPRREAAPVQLASLDPLALAEALVARDPALVVLDLRARRDSAGIPGALPADTATALELLATLPEGTTVVLYDESGTRTFAAAEWPRGLDYRYLTGGYAGWRSGVLEPVGAAPDADAATRRAAERRVALASYFSGAAAPARAPTTPAAGAAPGARAGKKRGGGC